MLFGNLRSISILCRCQIGLTPLYNRGNDGFCVEPGAGDQFLAFALDRGEV